MNKRDLLLHLKYTIENQCDSDIGPIRIQKVYKLDDLYLVEIETYFGKSEYSEIVKIKNDIYPTYELIENIDYKEYDVIVNKIYDNGVIIFNK